jgi:hypothetical protein
MTEKYESLDELFEDENFEISKESEDNVPLEVKNRLALALDVDDLIDARRLAGSLFDFFCRHCKGRVGAIRGSGT